MRNPSEKTKFEELLDNRGPFTYDEMFPMAYRWADKRNGESDDDVAKWSWDCGLKLNYDGDVIYFSSRFYPPHKNHVDVGGYDGTIGLYVLGEKKWEKKIEADTLDELAAKAERIVQEKVKDLKIALSYIF